MSEEDLKRIRSDVDEMSKALGVLPKRDDTTEPPKTQVPVTEVPVETEAPNTSAPKTDAPKTDAPKTAAPTTEVPMDDKDREIAELRAKLIEKEVGPRPTKAPTTEAPLTVETQDFVGDIDPSDLTKDELNKLLNSVFSQGVAVSVKNVRTILPRTITTEVETLNTLKKINEDFYASNEDLKSFQKVVATVFGELAAVDPKRKMEDILKDTAPEVRKRLGLPTPKPGKKQPTQQSQDKGKGGNPPKLPGKKGKAGGHSENKPLTGPAAEIAAMNETLGR